MMKDGIILNERTLLEMAHAHAWGEVFDWDNLSDPEKKFSSRLEKEVRLVVSKEAGKFPAYVYESLVDVYVRRGMPIDGQTIGLLGRYQAFAQRAFLNYLLEYAQSGSTPPVAEQILDKVKEISSDWINQSGRDLISLRDSITLCLAENSASVDAYVRWGMNLSERQRQQLIHYENQAKSLFRRFVRDVETGNPPTFVKSMIEMPRTTPYHLGQPPQLP